MSEEKKKGRFWSWLGLGKNKLEPQSTNEQKEQHPKEQLNDNETVIEEKPAQTASHDFLEVDPTTEMSETPVVESAGDFSQEIEQEIQPENQDLFTITTDNPATETETETETE
ncbi:hypothetical protein ACE4RU_07435, partial [Actinobacillus seminis]